jgi:hypothetical protein
MKTFILILISITLSGVVGYLIGMKAGCFQAALEENKIAAVILKQNQPNLSSELREYLKGRIYYNLSTKFPNKEGYLKREDWDFGEVDPTKLKGIEFRKDPTVTCNTFEQSMTHHGGLIQSE